jgi:hypothetical protein
MNTLDVAVTATFIFSGLRDAEDACVTEVDIYDKWGQGALELHHCLCGYAEGFVKMIDALDPQDFPGVFDYEVSEVFGGWFGRHLIEQGSAPSVKEATHHMRYLVAKYFAQDERGDGFEMGRIFGKLEAVEL